MDDVARATALLKQGRLVAFPTETVYGLGADATNPAAVERIYQTKGRPGSNPLIVHVADVATARRYVAEWPEVAGRLAERFWPGPLTLVLPKNPVIPGNVTAGLGTVGVRVPNHPLALELLGAFGGALAAPSANRSNRVSPTTAQHVREEFPKSAAAGGDAGNEPAMILDGGACQVGIESTVLDLTTDVPTILRPGRVTAAEIEAVVGRVAARGQSLAATTPAVSPGQQEVHYAPTTRTYRFETSQRGMILPETDGVPNGIVVLSPLVIFKKWGPIVAMPREPEWYARELYGVLRELDAQALNAIYVEMPPDTPDWGAVRDRLTRASKRLPTV